MIHVQLNFLSIGFLKINQIFVTDDICDIEPDLRNYIDIKIISTPLPRTDTSTNLIFEYCQNIGLLKKNSLVHHKNEIFI